VKSSDRLEVSRSAARAFVERQTANCGF